MKDNYRHIARIYDRLFDNMNKGLRLAGIRMFRPSKGMHILDVGCGTGMHLELYQRFGCSLYGIDSSPSMLDIARARLGDSARLELGDATRMPYADHQFDLILSMLSLHEMTPQTRTGVVAEMKRVLKDAGHILLIDFHPGPYIPLQGWTSKGIIFLSELAAGREHFKNHRRFLAAKGLPTLAAQNELEVEKHSILAGGSLAVFLLTLKKAS
jgi:ubiquinone/menaquinone biosynthesis C-methylase UbiE